MSILILPIIFIFILIYGHLKKVNCYSSFVQGAKNGLKLGFEIFPFIATILIAVSIFRESGLTVFITQLLAPIFNGLGIPTEVTELLILRPFTGSGSFAILSDIFAKYGADSYIARCASVIMGSSETIFYVSAVYVAGTKIKNLAYAIPVALISTFLGAILGCLICKVL